MTQYSLQIETTPMNLSDLSTQMRQEEDYVKLSIHLQNRLKPGIWEKNVNYD